MKINFGVRFKNPTFWVGLVVSCVLIVLAQLGLKWEDIKTWEEFGRVLTDACQSPVIVVAVLGNIYNAFIDPTTKGLSDSNRALNYTVPASTKNPNGNK